MNGSPPENGRRFPPRMICTKARRGEQPSTVAASSNSRGTPVEIRAEHPRRERHPDCRVGEHQPAALDLVQGDATWKDLTKTGSKIPLTLGLVDARNTRRDDPRALAKAALRLKGKVPLEESFISPSNGLEFLPRGRAREKLGLVSETAKLVEAGL